MASDNRERILEDLEDQEIKHQLREAGNEKIEPDSTNIDKDNDPSSGNQTKKKKKKKKESGVPLHRLFRFASKVDIMMIILASIGSIGVGVMMPCSMIILGRFLDNLGASIMNTDGILSNTIDAILVLVYLGCATLVGAYLAHAFWVISGESQAREIRRLYMHAILRQDMEWFDKAEEGSLTTRLATDTQMIQDGISEKFGSVLQMTAQLIAGIIVGLVYGWRLALVILATLPITAGLGGLMGYSYDKFTKEAQDIYAAAGAIAEEVFSGIRTVYSFSLQRRFSSKYESELAVARKTGVRRGLMLSFLFGGFMATFFCSYGLSFWYGSQLVRQGKMTGAEVIIVFYSLLVSTLSLLNLPLNLSAVASATAAAHRIFSLIDRLPPIDTDSTEGLAPKEGLRGDIQFSNVDFNYPSRPDIPILRGFTASIRPGKTVAIVGPSGSGKSTAIQLIQRFYDPLSGNILLDGHDIKDYNLQWLRNQIGVVSQEPVLFNMSIRKNLLMGATRHVSEEELIAACRSANCHDFIMQLPNKYDTQVGQYGGMLSGGQKQRVAIARAILKNPAILLLDEATSALDTQSERLVQTALEVASRNRTTIVIAHRLSTIRNADLIIVLSQGDVIEQGTHEHLIGLNGVYAGLVKKQEIATKEDTLTGMAENQPDETVAPCEDELAEEKIEMGFAIRRQSTKHSNVSSMNDRKEELKEDRLQKEREAKFKGARAPFFKVLMQMRPEWNILAVGLIGCTICGAVFPCSALVLGRVFGVLVDPTLGLGDGPMEGANLYAFLFVVCAIAILFGQIFQIGAFECAGEYYTERLRGRLFRAYMRQEVGFYDSEGNNIGALTSMLALDAKNVNDLITKVLGEVFSVIFSLVAGLLIAFLHGWPLTLVILAVLPLMVAAEAYEARVEMGFEDDTKKAGIESGEVAGEAIKTIRTVVALVKQDYFEKKYYKATEYPHKLAIRKAYKGSAGFALAQAIQIYLNAIAFYAGVRFIEKGLMDIQGMMVVQMALLFTAMGIGRAANFVPNIVKGKYAALSCFEILDRQPLIDPDVEGIEPATIKGNVAFEKIAFAYPRRPDIPIFNGDFSLEGTAGQTIALVGSSGCGKSTTIGMLERWYDPSAGSTRVDDTSTKGYTLGNLRSHMALVGQEPVLFDMSIAENIRFGVPDGETATQQDIENACKAANIHKFIASLPQGYDTRVGDKGSQLSGGQKQRIAIARALIRNPRILLLDEATSALDSESEKLVQAAIDNAIQEGGRTTITIAHRLSTIQNADQICVVRDGRVIERGSHWELLKLDGVYKELVQQQSLSIDQ
ncbi:putative ABC transporter protein [Dichotomocladium elegans]|nr:putative ABC transporter protein [Dichotomocladium elegans]